MSSAIGRGFTIAGVPSPRSTQRLCPKAQPTSVGRGRRRRHWSGVSLVDGTFIDGVGCASARHAGLTGPHGGEGAVRGGACEAQRGDGRASTLLSMGLCSCRRDRAGIRVRRGTGVGWGSAEETRHLLTIGE